MKIITMTAIAAISLSACATVTPVPNTRKLTPDLMSQMGATDAVIVKNNGVRAGWTSAGVGPAQDYTYVVPAGTSPAAAGIGAGLGHAIGVAIVDAAPSARAKRAVKSINSGIDKQALDEAFIRKIKSVSTSGSVKPGNIETAEFNRKDPDPQGKLKIKTEYTLAEDASAVRVSALVTYVNDEMSYQTPYDFGGKPPKSEVEGALYRNRFTYHSDKFEAPELTDAVRDQLMQAIKSQYAEDVTSVNESDDEAKKKEKQLSKLDKRKNKALEAAGDDKLSKIELATLLIDKWRGNRNPALSTAIDDGQTFIAEMMFTDLNNSDIPHFERQTPLPETKGSFWKGVPIIVGPIGNHEYSELEQKANGRKVIRLDSGPYAGAYHSYPKSGFASFGNTYKVAG